MEIVLVVFVCFFIIRMSRAKINSHLLYAQI